MASTPRTPTDSELDQLPPDPTLAEDAELPHVVVWREASPPVVFLRGDVDIEQSEELYDAFVSLTDEAEVIVDLSETTFIDSAVIGACIQADRRGLRVTMMGACEAVMRTLLLAGVDQVLRIDASEVGRAARQRQLAALSRRRAARQRQYASLGNRTREHHEEAAALHDKAAELHERAARVFDWLEMM